MIAKWLLGMFLQHWLKAALIGGVMAVAVGIYASGYKAAWRIAEADTLRAKIASQQRDIDANRLQRQRDQDVIAQLEGQAKEDEAQNERLKCELANRPAGAGRGLTQSELDILLDRKSTQGQHGGTDLDVARSSCLSAAGVGG